VSETLNGKEIYNTDEVIAAIAVYLRTARNMGVSGSSYDVHEGAEALYAELVGMGVINTLKDQIIIALAEENE
jgi:hypothetical protein